MKPKPNALRQCNLDLLRIFAMFFIVLLHSVDHSGVLEAVTDQGKLSGSLYVYFIYALTQICVNCYILLSGYFLATSRFKLSKLVTLWLETVVYSLLFRLVFMLSGAEPISTTSLVSCFVPITTGRYWFITIYFGMYLLSPFLNVAIRALGCKKHALLNAVLFVVMSAWSSLHPSIAGMNSGGGWGLAWFVVLYLLGAWLRLYYRPNYKILSKLLSWLSIPALMTVALFVTKYFGIGIAVSVTRNWFRYDSVPVYFATLIFFCMFLNLRKPEGGFLAKLISFVSPLTFGVYLIHAHANVSPWLWEHSMLAKHTQELYFPLMQIGIVIGVFCICILIDAVRAFLFRPLEHSQWLKKSSEAITSHIASSIEKFTLHFTKDNAE